MDQVVDRLWKCLTDNFTCAVCREFIEKQTIRMLDQCSHLVCINCINNVCRKDNTVVCPVCTKHQSYEDVCLGDVVIIPPLFYFNSLVQAVKEDLHCIGSDEGTEDNMILLEAVVSSLVQQYLMNAEDC